MQLGISGRRFSITGNLTMWKDLAGLGNIFLVALLKLDGHGSHLLAFLVVSVVSQAVQVGFVVTSESCSPSFPASIHLRVPAHLPSAFVVEFLKSLAKVSLVGY